MVVPGRQAARLRLNAPPPPSRGYYAATSETETPFHIAQSGLKNSRPGHLIF
jgi:hypothetical protein